MDNMIIKRCPEGSNLELRDHEGLKYLVFPELEKIDGFTHMFSTRLGGVSKGCYSECNLSYTRGDEKEDVDENFRRVSDAMGHGKKLDDFVLTYQTHTTNIRVVTEDDRGKGPARERDYRDVDGLVTNIPRIILGTFHADCPPVYFIDPVNKAIGLAHSGWKGTKGKISAEVIKVMAKEYGTKAADLICAIGPSICGDCYEIGSDVAVEFTTAFSDEELYGRNEETKDVLFGSDEQAANDRSVGPILIQYPNDKYRLHLWNAIKLTLIQAGVQPENIAVTDICTRCNPDLLFSHRIHGELRGNLGAFLCIDQ